MSVNANGRKFRALRQFVVKSSIQCFHEYRVFMCCVCWEFICRRKVPVDDSDFEVMLCSRSKF